MKCEYCEQEIAWLGEAGQKRHIRQHEEKLKKDGDRRQKSYDNRRYGL